MGYLAIALLDNLTEVLIGMWDTKLMLGDTNWVVHGWLTELACVSRHGR